MPAPRVAVFDGGIDSRASLPSLFPEACVDLTPEPPTPDEIDHGTGVTGAVMYGLSRPGTQAPQPPLPVTSYRVLPAPDVPGDLDGYWVLDQIKKAVVDGDYKIVNLSLGPTLAVEDTMEPNRWTSELDQLAWENDVLFVIAAGNDGEQDRATGLHRIQVPGDMVNGLTVGACDAAPPNKPWSRAPYSSMGPGRQGSRIQPIGVQFGGVDADMYPVIRADGTFLQSLGTSFAAPLTTHALADLATRLPNPTPSVLRAFAAHFTDRPRNHRVLQDEIGFGRIPLNFADLLDCEPNEVHILYADEIERGELIGYRVPIPSESQSHLAVRITLAYASPIEPTQPTEYTCAALELAFRPHHHIYRFRPPKESGGRDVELDMTSPEALALIQAGWQMGQEPVTKGLGSSNRLPEHQLRDGGKWETLRHARITLNSEDYEEPRLEISYVARRGGGLDRAPTKVPFALLISVMDKSPESDLYDQTIAQYPALQPLQPITTRVRLHTQQ
nr:S8 family peptidase [Microbispora sp. NBRC 16548]